MNNLLKKILYDLKILSLPFYIFRIFPINNNKIVCSNFYGKGYGDSPKYICEELLKATSKYDIVWVVKDNNEIHFPKNIRTVKINTIQYIYELVTAKVWIFNCRKNRMIKKRKKQYYIQTWHGGIALKKIEKDAINKLDANYIKQAKEDSNAIDLMISNGKFCTEMYRRAFWYTKEILECGTPRNDILINSDKNKIREKVNKYFNFKNENFVILYAPTFRNSYENNPYDINLEIILNNLKIKTGRKCNILVKLHPNIKNAESFFDFSNKKIINAHEYNDIQELIIASDLVITDYSSVMFESMIANTKVILYANDINDYVKERGFYFKFEELPFKLAQDNSDLQKILEEYNSINFEIDYKKFKNRIGLVEKGEASKKVCNRIIGLERFEE